MNRMDKIETTPVWLRLYTIFVALATLFLIYAGAMVTSTGSGLAVPDWPLSYGMVFPPMVGGIFYEHGHRMIAASVGLFTVIQALLLQKFEPKRFVRILGWLSVLTVVVQGVLGGLTVLFLLPPVISIGHAGLAELFFVANVAIAFFTSASYVRIRAANAGVDVSAATRTLPVVIFIQILLGALMRHLGAGLAIPDFPLSMGRIIPPMTSTAIAVNFAHRAGALVVLVAAVWVAVKVIATGSAPLKRLVVWFTAAFCFQIVLAAFTVWSGRNPVITSFHVAAGATLFALSLLIALVAGAAQRPAEQVSGIGREVTA